MLESGYIKVYRSLLFWEWYDDANTLRVFLHLLLTANHEEQSWKGIKVQRGQRVSSFSKIGQELGLSEKEVRTAVRHLIKTGEVAHNATSKYGVFTVNNYDRFQMRAPSGEPEREPKWHPEGGQPEGHRKSKAARGHAAGEVFGRHPGQGAVSAGMPGEVYPEQLEGAFPPEGF